MPAAAVGISQFLSGRVAAQRQQLVRLLSGMG